MTLGIASIDRVDFDADDDLLYAAELLPRCALGETLIVVR
jgi:hypothetical protein